ncbi:hypothetical protein Mp_4g04250 [Marchantia polymorpha subsp. ruderalis]|uniref:Uncharacterized protein n=2 Tax=Marchantia polymorpha TaxID=3197 RepID=A0AAF6B686_MARPO|nr:hypothetical protein MARPO_0044s0048 [Marchantia polymorpha]BBN07520.1 hypothetical protein Mp_4g04250 [Marchantia polymorpha subsp. ruderalis]|eukprot:PTQ39580.1 hypothetical protein MARPO_0044s0048 [Marchantia polymorpha]
MRATCLTIHVKTTNSLELNSSEFENGSIGEQMCESRPRMNILGKLSVTNPTEDLQTQTGLQSVTLPSGAPGEANMLHPLAKTKP